MSYVYMHIFFNSKKGMKEKEWDCDKGTGKEGNKRKGGYIKM